ncbi:MAG: glycine cleavage system protein H [Planctomycetota bacterium]
MANQPQPGATPLHFMMGEFRAEFPTDRAYAKNHMWALKQADGVWRFGFTAYAVRLLQDVYFLDWEIDAGAELAEKQEIGQIESQKAEASLYAPLAGRVTAINQTLLADPSAINVDKYGAGWLLDIESTGAGLLSPEDYVAHVDAVWGVTQRTIKGQMNE